MNQHQQRYNDTMQAVYAWTAEHPGQEAPKDLRLDFAAACDALDRAVRDWRFDDDYVLANSRPG